MNFLIFIVFSFFVSVSFATLPPHKAKVVNGDIEYKGNLYQGTMMFHHSDPQDYLAQLESESVKPDPYYLFLVKKPYFDIKVGSQEVGRMLTPFALCTSTNEGFLMENAKKGIAQKDAGLIQRSLTTASYGAIPGVLIFNNKSLSPEKLENKNLFVFLIRQAIEFHLTNKPSMKSFEERYPLFKEHFEACYGNELKGKEFGEMTVLEREAALEGCKKILTWIGKLESYAAFWNKILFKKAGVDDNICQKGPLP